MFRGLLSRSRMLCGILNIFMAFETNFTPRRKKMRKFFSFRKYFGIILRSEHRPQNPPPYFCTFKVRIYPCGALLTLTQPNITCLLLFCQVVLSKSGELREASQPFIHSVRLVFLTRMATSIKAKTEFLKCLIRTFYLYET